ncbi:hypothetical protein [Dielma fastidiosa]|uniref:XkdX family protein n=1 Tax=Dielma fastidiosa TaxID=1034346 RepID=A0AB35URB8_9FIRM|nr:hypothetical protein [Dielma fastidiosa]MDY5168619.1 hypothetical protein [Dielma fastidiosa]
MRVHVESLKRCFSKGEITADKIQVMTSLTADEKEFILADAPAQEEYEAAYKILVGEQS